jgi:hypothetical protein
MVEVGFFCLFWRNWISTGFNMDKNSLVSAIIGGLATAVCSLIIGYIFYWRDKREKRKRVAYLYYVRISQLLTIKKFIDNELKDALYEFRQMSNEDKLYTVHLACATIVEMLKKIGIDALLESSGQDKQKIIDVFKNFKNQADDFFGLKIDDEMLSNLPKNTILHYTFLISELLGLKYILSLWISSVESNDFSSFKAEDILMQGMSIKRLLESTDIVASTLIKKAGIKRKDANNILALQINKYSKEYQKLKVGKRIFELMKDFDSKNQNQTEK